MFKSIKTKIILTVMLLFLIGVSAMTTISSMQVKTKTEKGLIDQSSVLVNEMSQGITYFLGQHEKGLLQLSNTQSITDFDVAGGTADEAVAKTSLAALNSEFDAFLGLYDDTSSVYYSLPNKHTTIVPYADLGAFDPTTRPWYVNAMENSDTVQWTSPYIDEVTGEYVITASKAVLENGIITGVAGLDIQLTALTNQISNSELGYDGYPMILDPEGAAIVHPTLRGENLMEFPYVAEMFNESNTKGEIHYSHEGIKRVNVFTTIPNLGWKVSTVYDQKNINATAADLRNSMIIVALATLLVIFVALYVNNQSYDQTNRTLKRTHACRFTR